MKVYIVSIILVFILAFIFILTLHRQNESRPTSVIVDNTSKNALTHQNSRSQWKEGVLKMLESTDVKFENLSPVDQEQLITDYGEALQETNEDFANYIAKEDQKYHKEWIAFEKLNTEDKINWLMENGSLTEEYVDILESIRKSEKRIAEWNASRPQREAEAEKRRLETEAANLWFEQWKRETNHLLKQLDSKLRGVRPIVLDDTFDKARSDNESTVSPTETSIASKNEVNTLQTTHFDAVSSLSKAQERLETFRVDLDEKYFDVVVSKQLSAQELDKYFPTEVDRKMLSKRTERFELEIVSKIRDLVKDIPNAKQKREITRELVTANFDKDFADNVLKALQNDVE